MSSAHKVLLVCHNSPGRDLAITVAAALFPEAEIVVLTTWEPIASALVRHAMGSPLVVPSDAVSLDRSTERRALDGAEAVAAFARELGLVAHARTVASSSDVAVVIADVAAEVDADLLVLDSTAQMLRRGSRPVLLVPAHSKPHGRRGLRGWLRHPIRRRSRVTFGPPRVAGAMPLGTALNQRAISQKPGQRPGLAVLGPRRN